MKKPNVSTSAILQTVGSGVILALLISVMGTYNQVKANTDDIKDMQDMKDVLVQIEKEVGKISEDGAINRTNIEWIKTALKKL